MSSSSSALAVNPFQLRPGAQRGDSLPALDLGRYRFAFDPPTPRYAAIAILRSLDEGAQAGVFAELERRGGSPGAGPTAIFVAVAQERPDAAFEQQHPGVSFLWNASEILRSASPAPEGGWVVVDAALRVVSVHALSDSHAALASVDALAKTPRPAVPAPILVLPDVFEPELCDALIQAFEADGGRESGHMKDVGSTSVERLDSAWKRRRDAAIASPALIGAVRARIGRRICPEIRKAFQFVATRTERDLVARYDAETHGHFAQHRDDAGILVAHRRFALSLPLNDDFEGGDLSFPEFSAMTGRPAPGTAIVFSGSLLHKVSPVTVGRRYVFLTFLFDEAAEQLRLANLRASAQARATLPPTGSGVAVPAAFGSPLNARR